MHTEPMTLLTIVAEAVLEDRLVADMKRLGVSGYTVSTVHGEGRRGQPTSDWEGGNVRIESLLRAELADQVLECLARDYFAHYDVVAYVSVVQVVRAAKFR